VSHGAADKLGLPGRSQPDQWDPEVNSVRHPYPSSLYLSFFILLVLTSFDFFLKGEIVLIHHIT
jgi:hypothetical protein